MDIRVLGHVRAADDVRLGPTQRRLVALLAAREGEVVSIERIADALGGVTPSAVRTTVSRLRQVVGDAIVGEPPGYRVRAGSTDAGRFEELARAARDAPATAEALAVADEALSLWSGDAFGEFAHEPWAIGRATALDELRRQLAEDRTELLFSAERLDEAVAAAERLVGEQPLRERSWALLMRGLAAQGRRTDALRAFQAYRDRLASVGTEPRESMYRLDAEIASGDLAPLVAATAARHPRGEAPIDPPTGLVAFVFTDIERSTEWWQRDPVGMSSSLRAHDELVRATIERRGGRVFGTSGDGFAAAFADVSAAVETASELQVEFGRSDNADGPALRLRIGVHLGDAELRGGDYFGAAVNVAARVCAAGHGGQTLVTEVVRAAADLDAHRLGEFRLRGLDRPAELHQLGPGRFPALRAEPVRRTNLPGLATETIGRRSLIARVGEQLGTARAVTLVGGGGHGKTRAALEIATAATHSDGVWFVDLSPVTDGAAVPEAVATALAVQRQTNLTTTEAIVDWLRGRELLVVLDNCEHVLDAAGELVDAIRAATDAITLLATSRQPLRVPGEVVITVPPLAIEDAVQLFVARAHDAGGEPIPDEERPVVEAICRRLDGIPLAIELAAARARALAPAEIRMLLDDRLHLPGAVSDDAGRRRTLRATIGWSYDMLTEAERIALDRASVFARGFDLAAAEAVLADGELPRADAVDATLALVDRSLLVGERTGDGTRFRMLETVRLYAAEQLRARGEGAEVARRMVEHLVGVVERARESWFGPGQPDADAVVEVEWDNLRVALSSAIRDGELDLARRIVLATNPTAFCRLAHEHAGWADDVLRELPDDVDVLGIATRWAWARLEHERLTELAERAIESAARQRRGAAVARSFLVLLGLVSGRSEAAAAMFPELRAEIDAMRDPYDRVVAMFPLALARYVGVDDGDDVLDQMLAEADAAGSPSLRAAASFFAASALLSDDEVDTESLDAHLELAIDQARLAGDRVWEVQALNAAAQAAVRLARADSLERCRVVLARAYDTRFWVVAGQAAQVALAALEAAGSTEAAATVAGGLERHFPVVHPSARKICDHYLAESRRHPRSGAWMARGAAMSRDRLVQYAIAQVERAQHGRPV